MRNIRLAPVALALLPILSACGGSGGGSGSGAQDAGVQTGYLVDSPIQGVGYATATRSGTTGADGSFTYLPGERVTFSIGTLVLGEGAAQALMTPFDLFPDAEAPENQQALVRLLREMPDASQIRIEDVTPAASIPGGIQAINQLILLQALDSDSNPDNGITIAEGMAALLEGADIDFARAIGDFLDQDDLERVLQLAAGAGLLASPRVPSAGEALAHFYAAQGIDFADSRLVAETVDWDPGAAGYNSRREYTYDANGRIVRDRRDENGDGLFDSTTEFDYREDGQVQEQRVSSAMGDSRYTTVYDGQGRRIRFEQEYTGDGVVDECQRYTWGDHGRLVNEAQDDGCDGTLEAQTQFDYDALGNLIRKSSDNFGGDGVIDRIEAFEYTDSRHPHRLTRELKDPDGDGTWEFVYRTTYSPEGDVLMYEADEDDGRSRTVSVRDENGRLVRQAYDAGADGTEDSVLEYTYDALGNLVLYEHDRDGDGAIDRREQYAYADTAHPYKITTAVVDPDGDGPDQAGVTTYTYHALGLVVRKENDANGDGTPETIYGFAYDADGNRLEEWEDWDADGTPNQFAHYTYDANGRVLTETYDNNGDGTPDRRTTREYEPGTAVDLPLDEQGGAGPR